MNRFKHKLIATFTVSVALLLATAPGVRDSLAQDGLSLWEGANDLKDFPVFEQPDGISCGPTCCSMVLKYYGTSAGIGPLKTAAGTRWYQGPNVTGRQIKVGMTLPSGIENALETYGLSASVVDGSTEDVIKLIDKKRPPILLVRSGEDTWHYVVATGYRHNVRGPRLEINIADPATGKTRWIDSGKLDAAWRFSHDLSGQPIEGRRCRTCGGNGNVGGGWTTCVVCSGSGTIKAGPLKTECSACSGRGKWSSAGTKCPLCGGDGRETDYFRKLVESVGVSGHTLIAVTNRTGGTGGGSTGGTGAAASSMVKVEYTIKNNSGRTVRFKMHPSGKSYTLDVGKTFSGTSNAIDGKAPTITLSDSSHTYKLTAGNHQFWWMSEKGRIGFDRSTD